MNTLKLTVFIEDNTDLAMEVHVVAPEHGDPIADATFSRNARAIDDEYELGGYAGI